MNRSLNSLAVNRRRLSGFTVLEVLVATVMFSILITALYTVFYGALRLREKTYELVEANVPKDHIISRIRHDLDHIMPANGLMAGQFVGENDEEGGFPFDTLEIHTASANVTESEPWGDIQRIEYFLVEPTDEFEDDAELIDGQGYDLVRSVIRNLLETEIEEPDEEVLLNGVLSLDFTYYDGEYWQESWDSTTAEVLMPVALKAHVEFVQYEDTSALSQEPIEIVCELIMKEIKNETDDSGTAAMPGGNDTGGAPDSGGLPDTGGQPGGGTQTPRTGGGQ